MACQISSIQSLWSGAPRMAEEMIFCSASGGHRFGQPSLRIFIPSDSRIASSSSVKIEALIDHGRRHKGESVTSLSAGRTAAEHPNQHSSHYWAASQQTGPGLMLKLENCACLTSWASSTNQRMNCLDCELLGLKNHGFSKQGKDDGFEDVIVDEDEMSD